ncbi:MAG: hypothetical protein ACLRRE_02410 [[Eubacterium] siraeum]
MSKLTSAVNGSVFPKIRILRFALSVPPTARGRLRHYLTSRLETAAEYHSVC